MRMDQSYDKKDRQSHDATAEKRKKTGYDRKNKMSEGMTHERDRNIAEEHRMEGYEPHPADRKPSEVFGLHNSFDDISVGLDGDGLFTIAVSSQKELHSPTLDSDRKTLKGRRRRKMFERFGDFYLNSASPRNSAFAFHAKKDLSENRILSEFRTTAKKRLTQRQMEAAPFLTLDRDRRRLEEMRGLSDKTARENESTADLENSVIIKTALENRFLRKLRLARKIKVPEGADTSERTEEFVLIPEEDTEDTGIFPDEENGEDIFEDEENRLFDDDDDTGPFSDEEEDGFDNTDNKSSTSDT